MCAYACLYVSNTAVISGRKMERGSQVGFAALGRAEQKLEAVFPLQEGLLSSVVSSYFIFTFRTVLG